MRIISAIFLTTMLVLVVLHFGTNERWPNEMLLSIQRWNSPQLVFLLQKFSDSISVVSIGIPILTLIISEIKKNTSKRRSVLLILICLAVSGINSSIVKNVVKKPRPFVIESRIEKLSGGGSYSFPSGHTTEAVCAATIMIFTFRNWYVWFFYVGWALTIMYSRMALGVHDIFDLIGGAAIGLGSTLLVLFAASRIVAKKDQLAN